MTKTFTLTEKGVIPAACLLAASLVVLARAGDKAQLTGHWNFNPNVSDDAGQKIRDAQQNNNHPSDATRSYPGTSGPHPGGYPGVGVDAPLPGGGARVGDPDGTARGEGGAPIGGAGGGVNYPGGNSGDPGSRGRSGGPDAQGKSGSGASSQGWDWLTKNPEFLQIDQRGKQIVITDDSGHAQTYYPDGKKHEGKDANGNKISTKAEWEGTSLVAETKLGRSEILTETFRLSEDRNQLYVKSRLETPSLPGPVNIRRVYDLAKALTN